MEARLANEVSVADLFDQFIEATTMKNVLSLHHRIMNYSDLSPCQFNLFYPKLKSAVMTNRTRKNWKAKALFTRLDKKAAHRCYSNTKIPTPLGNRPKQQQQLNISSQEAFNSSLSTSHPHYSNDALQNLNCLVIGSGPAGLRTAIEMQLLGASKVVVVEKRSRFSRNNVLHLWPFVIHDLKSLGAKKFYGKFCAGSIDHISIRQLQLILLKICLILGCDFRDSCSYLHLCPASIKISRNANETTDNGSTWIQQTTKCDLDNLETSKIIDYVKVSDKELVSSSNTSSIREDAHFEDNPNGSLPIRESSITEDYISSDTNDQDNQENLDLSINTSIKDGKSTFNCDSIQRGKNISGSRAHFQSEYKLQEKELHGYEWDIIIGADGRRNTLSKYFPRKEFRGRLAIAITANFINRQTPAESAVPEISGLSFIYNQDMFQALAYDENINLENICYYKDDTHYFVMTAKKKSLLERGVLIDDYSTTQDLLSEKNVNRQALLDYARDAAYWTTGLKPLDFALNHYGQEDCAMFDFTSMYAAANACKALRTAGGGLTLVSLVGDSLLEPFWPTGSGCARGFLSSFDAAWMCRQWAVHRCPIIEHFEHPSKLVRGRGQAEYKEELEPTTHNRMALSVMAERESIYRILAQTTSENLQQTYAHWTLNPHSRYPNLNRHLVLPSQVEHLMTCTESRSSPIHKGKTATSIEKVRRVKSPAHQKKLQKKLKSANVSPQSKPRDLSNWSRTVDRQRYKSKSRNDIDSYLELERSYRDLVGHLDKHQPSHYLSYGLDDCDDELSAPSISGISPSASNLLSLEAKRSRDIDECLRLRRQKNQISLVRDHLKQQFKVDQVSIGKKANSIISSELRRFREQRAQASNGQSDLGEAGPLTILNSIRRCASFAERVKSFENRTSSIDRDSTPVTPRASIDTVKNLPEFATLQKLFQSKDRESVDPVKKLKLPVMKLSKDDWNVKCWEKRLAAYKQRSTFGGSTRSLNKALSVDSYTQSNSSGSAFARQRSEKQVEVFRDRTRFMEDKLNGAVQRSKVETVKSQFKRLEGSQTKRTLSSDTADGARTKGWVSHIRSELIKSSDSNLYDKSKKASNPFAPRQQIKKLFQDDDDDEESKILVDKHFDHLCINRPTNKYLQRNAYTSHLARTKINTATARVIDREPVTASKAAYLTASSLAKGKSSSPGALSEHLASLSSSTNTLGTAGSSLKQQETVNCFRCKQGVSRAETISVGGCSLHRTCLTCASCGITLRTNEIIHHLGILKDKDVSETVDQKKSFVCSICDPSIRDDITKETASRAANLTEVSQTSATSSAIHRLRSREEFLKQQIDYGVLYKNIIDGNSLKTNNSSQNKDSLSRNRKVSSSSSSLDYEEARQDGLQDVAVPVESIMSPSPIKFTLPIELLSTSNGARSNTFDSVGYSLASSETVGGSEQVTLVLPCSSPVVEGLDSNREMMDEEELNRILHLDNPTSKHDDDESSASLSDEDGDDQASVRAGGVPDGLDENDSSDAELKKTLDLTDESSSLGSPSDSDSDDDSAHDDDDANCEDEDNNNEDYGEANSDDNNSVSDDFSTCDDRDDNSESRCSAVNADTKESRKIEQKN